MGPQAVAGMRVMCLPVMCYRRAYMPRNDQWIPESDNIFLLAFMSNSVPWMVCDGDRTMW